MPQNICPCQDVGMTEIEQTLLYATTGIILLGTLVVFIMQIVRRRGDDRHDD